MKTIVVIDGQGGGIGSTIIKKLREGYAGHCVIIALGTNAVATANMLKAGANRGASGQNAIVQTAHQADIIIGPISIVMANAMLGELTPCMAEAIASSRARKILIPLSQENVSVVGVSSDPLPRLIETMLVENLSDLVPGKE
jgi:NAD(P)-dependent dehydrogenase (short-subunit alcohol dehydrogenase family)